MFFWVKKLIGYWIMPLPACLALLVIGAVLLGTRRHARMGRVLAVVATLLLLLFSNKLVSVALVRPLETRYPAIPEITASSPPSARLTACRYVVVLGGGNASTPDVAALNRLSMSARARLTEAVRLLGALPDAKLLVSGPAVRGYPSHATVLEKAALSLGIAPDRIVRIEHARDTEDESIAAKHHAGDAPIALVTSAWHMPRSMALFRSAGVDAVPCPTDYTSHSDGRFHWRDLLCDVDSLNRSTVAIRERVGQIWISLRGKG